MNKLEVIRCRKCGNKKPETAFQKNDGRRRRTCRLCRPSYKRWYTSRKARAVTQKASRKHYLAHREKEIERVKAYKRRNPDKELDWHLRKKFGITLVAYREMLQRQGGLCAICKMPETAVDKRTKKVRRLHVDHDHDSGTVRGLLCTRCNFALGYTRENIRIIDQLKAYLIGAWEAESFGDLFTKVVNKEIPVEVIS